MNTRIAKWAAAVLVAVGLALVGAFFLDWIRGGVSGWRLAHDSTHWLFAVPAAGALLALAAGSRSKHTRLLAIAAGLLVVGDTSYHLLRGMIHSNATTWLLLGGAVVILLGVSRERRALRAVGGASVLLAMFAPWEHHQAMFTTEWRGGDLFSLLGVAMIFLLASLVGAIAACISAFTIKPWGGTVALIAGIAVFVAYLLLLLAVANLFLGTGAWITLGASVVALALGVVAPGERAPAPKGPRGAP